MLERGELNLFLPGHLGNQHEHQNNLLVNCRRCFGVDETRQDKMAPVSGAVLIIMMANQSTYRGRYFPHAVLHT